MNLTQKTKEYIDQHVAVKACLRKGLINYSALARDISKKIGQEDSFDAILVASRRYVDQLVFKDQEKHILALLKKSKVKMRTGLCRVILEPHTHMSDHFVPLHFIKGSTGITILTEEENHRELRRMYEHNILDTRKGLAEVVVVSSKDTDDTIGVTAYISTILASNDVNILTTFGSYKEDIFIIEEKDLSKVLKIFEKF